MSDAADQGIMTRGLFAAALLNLVGLFLSVYLMFTSPIRDTGIWSGATCMAYSSLGCVQEDGKTEDAKGVLAVAGITFLLSATCWVCCGGIHDQ